MDWKTLHGYVEVSPFLLFECTGDSEEASDLNNSSFDDDNMEVTCDDADDCQSCCSDSSELCNDNDQSQECTYLKKTDRKRVHGHDHNTNHRHWNDYDEHEDDDDGAIDQECSSRNAGFGYSSTRKKCKVRVDSKMEPIQKEEKDKLFWDACLAS